MLPISPIALVQGIVGNNPAAVHQNLMDLQLVGQSYQLTPDSFMDLMGKLPIENRAAALDLVSTALNVPIDNNRIGAQYLWQLMTTYSMNLQEMVYQVFDQNLPKMNRQASKTCGCGGHSPLMNTEQKWIIVLAGLGALFLIMLLFKLIFKILD